MSRAASGVYKRQGLLSAGGLPAGAGAPLGAAPTDPFAAAMGAAMMGAAGMPSGAMGAGAPMGPAMMGGPAMGGAMGAAMGAMMGGPATGSPMGGAMGAAMGAMMGGFGGPSLKPCAEVAMHTIASDGTSAIVANHIAVDRICTLSNDLFAHPSVKASLCTNSETFTTQMPDDPLIKEYMGGITLVGLYIPES